MVEPTGTTLYHVSIPLTGTIMRRCGFVACLCEQGFNSTYWYDYERDAGFFHQIVVSVSIPLRSRATISY